MTRRSTDFPRDRADLDGLVTWSIIRAARSFEHMLGEVLEPLNLTPVQFGALSHLSIASYLTQAQLAERVLMRPQSANYLLDVLIERGLVERTSDRGSGRANPVRLTAAGRRLLRKAWPAVVAANAAPSLGMAEGDVDRLRDLITTALAQQADSTRSHH